MGENKKKISSDKDYKLEDNLLKKFWKYIWYDDSFGSYVANLIVAFIFIKYIFFPVIGFALNNEFPIVAIVSGSMEHKIVNHQICGEYIEDTKSDSLNIEGWWNLCGNYYVENYNISLDEFKDYPYKNGLNIGDVMILYGKDPSNIDVGDVLVFIPQDKMENGQSRFFIQKGPVIHRVVEKSFENGTYYFGTKGDHNSRSQPNFETKIPETDVIAVGVVRVPFIGYAKIVLNNAILTISNIFN